VRTETEANDTRTDLDLIAEINGGSPEAFEVLYWRYRDWVLNLAVRLTGDNDMALDVLQETFLYLLRKFPGFRLTCQLKTFLYPAVRNLAIGARRKGARYQNNAADAAEIDSYATPESASTDDDVLQGVLQLLPEEQREVLLLRFVDDLSLAEVAATMAIPVGTVKSRLHNALQTLRHDEHTKNFFTG
jgi:RNA polymerase sigma-70 factor, ECF subfamily